MTERVWTCPVHGLIQPQRFDSDWPWEDEGEICPVIMADETTCGEQLEPAEHRSSLLAARVEELDEERLRITKDRNEMRHSAYAEQRRAESAEARLERCQEALRERARVAHDALKGPSTDHHGRFTECTAKPCEQARSASSPYPTPSSSEES